MRKQQQVIKQQSKKSTKATVLTVYDKNGKAVCRYTKKKLSSLGTVTRTYSGRDKKAKNKRQIKSYTGVDLEKLLKASGVGTAKEIKVVCDDQYTCEYNLSEIKNLYAFKSVKGSARSKVAPMIYVKERRILIGQEDYDSNYTKDFNMQKWAKGIHKIEVVK